MAGGTRTNGQALWADGDFSLSGPLLVALFCWIVVKPVLSANLDGPRAPLDLGSPQSDGSPSLAYRSPPHGDLGKETVMRKLNMNFVRTKAAEGR